MEIGDNQEKRSVEVAENEYETQKLDPAITEAKGIRAEESSTLLDIQWIVD